jgi:DNA-binding IclR family transcriptional regulator
MFKQLARAGKAVSSPKRLELLEILRTGPRTVDTLATEADMTRANTSRHLQLLHAARLVEFDKSGHYVTYRIAGSEVVSFVQSVCRLAMDRMPETMQTAEQFLAAGARRGKIDRKKLSTTLLTSVLIA